VVSNLPLLGSCQRELSVAAICWIGFVGATAGSLEEKKNKMRFILRKKIVANNRTKDDLIQDSIVWRPFDFSKAQNIVDLKEKRANVVFNKNVN